MTNPVCPKCKKTRMVKNGFTSSTGKLQWLCRSSRSTGRVYCYSTVNPKAPYRDSQKRSITEQPKARKKFRRKIDTGKTLVFTSAQNATPVHDRFFGALKTFCKAHDAELCVIPLRYRNPTSVFSNSQRGSEVWDPALKDYMYEQRKKLNDNLVAVGDVKIQPTASDPLSRVEGLTYNESGIFGHTKLRMKCVATPQNKLPKILTTTGAVTVPNYTDSKAGKMGAFHHVLGAVVVQILSPTKFHLHHINARKSDGAFIFIDTEYHSDGTVKKAEHHQAIIFGDAHYRFADPEVVAATFDKGGLVDTLNPDVLVWHDLLDCYFGNPHHKGNPFIEIAKRRQNYHLARSEVEETVAWMQRLSKDRLAYIVASNHDDMFARWIIREDWKEHPDNAEFYLETALQMARSAKMSETGAEYLDPFGYWLKKLTGDDPSITALRKNESLRIADIECSFHGDKGPNGARGTVDNLSKIGVKVISGHGHSPAIKDGHYRTGTMTRLTAEYVQGPNAWLNTHVSIDAFGKRHLHTCIDGNFWLR